MRTVISTLYSALNWVEAIAVYLIVRVIGTLVADQVKAWLPGLRASMVRRQAASMGTESGRFEEEWLGHLDRTPGELAKLWIVLTLFLVPSRTALERWVDSPDRLKHLAARGILDHGWVTVAAAFVWICLHYPPSSTRSAAYSVLVPIVGAGLLILNRRVRAALNSFYEDRLSHTGRVGVGAMIVPLLVYVIVFWSLVPTTGPALTTRRFVLEEPRPTLFVVPRSALSMDSRVTVPNDPKKVLPLMRGIPRKGPTVLNMNSAHRDVRLVGVRRAPAALFAAQELPAPPSFIAEPFDLSQIPGALLPLQPIPTLQEQRVGFRPASPINLRIVK